MIFKENPAIKAMAEVMEFLWTKAIKPLGEWLLANPDTIVGFVASLGVALVTYKIASTIGNIVSFIGGINGLVGLLGKLFGILTNPWAIAIGAVAGAITAVAIAIKDAQREAQEADLGEGSAILPCQWKKCSFGLRS